MLLIESHIGDTRLDPEGRSYTTFDYAKGRSAASALRLVVYKSIGDGWRFTTVNIRKGREQGGFDSFEDAREAGLAFLRDTLRVPVEVATGL